MSALQKQELAVVAQPDSTSLMQIINRAATDPAFDVAKLEQLLAMKERWEANEAKNAFNDAFTQFKAEAVAVLKNRQVTDGPLKGKSYAELYSVVNAVTPALSKYGLSTSWRMTKDEKDWIEITCVLKHVRGHFEQVSMGGPPDAGGAKSAIQARASTISYLERYSLKAVCGVAEQGDDNDGAGGNGKGLKESTVADHCSAIEAASDMKELQKVYSTAAANALTEADKPAMTRFIEAKEKRQKELVARAKEAA